MDVCAEELNRVTKPQIASAILRGLEKGYRHGPGPRLSFEYDEDVFRNVSTGLTTSQVVASVPLSFLWCVPGHIHCTLAEFAHSFFLTRL